MRCPYCLKSDTQVLDSRPSMDSIRRRRSCKSCSKRFTTYERIENTLSVIKKDGKIQLFDRQKLLHGILKACEKRPVTIEQIENMLDYVEAELHQKHTTKIPTKMIGDLVINKLKKLDGVAYMRFTSVYRSFRSPRQFAKEVEKLKK
ncbi:transcriptional regulator NrdR [Candidatus Woesearchaeota archaeon]|nr:transcriptional regulator NrdR [Candidatus Woesearchaeota archaeon]MBW3005239.1 transcriptional regulator NrdR [Candidatus Woesearchaeota archaeon]